MWRVAIGRQVKAPEGLEKKEFGALWRRRWWKAVEDMGGPFWE